MLTAEWPPLVFFIVAPATRVKAKQAYATTHLVEPIRWGQREPCLKCRTEMTPPTSGKSHAFPSFVCRWALCPRKVLRAPKRTHHPRKPRAALCLFIFYLSTRCIRANEEEWIDPPPGVPEGGYSCPSETHKHHRYFHEPFPALKKVSPAKVCD